MKKILLPLSLIALFFLAFVAFWANESTETGVAQPNASSGPPQKKRMETAESPREESPADDRQAAKKWDEIRPEPGSKLGAKENEGWVAGRIGRFFPDAEVRDTMLRSLEPGVQDRKTLIVSASPEREQILIEERLHLPEDGPAEIISSNASSATSMIVGLAGARSMSTTTTGSVDEEQSFQTLSAAAEEEGYQVTQESDYSPVIVEFEKAETVEEVLLDREAAQSLPAVRYIEPDYIVTTQAEPNDPAYLDATLWGMHNTGQEGGTEDVDINAPEAWATRTSAEGVIVAVIDTGVFYDHEDLKDNMWINPDEIPDNGIDDDGNGFVDDVYGINAINMDGDPVDDHSHGTHCAGTIGGQGNNGVGVTGVAWDVQIMALKFLSAGGSGRTSDAVTCVNYATAMGAHLSSNSWGGGGYSQALFDAFKAAEEVGVITVAAAGNSRQNIDKRPTYPASYELPSMVAVAAVDREGELAWFSNYGKNTVDIAAPGVDIYSSINEVDGYASYSGTSMACPHAAGALALLKAVYPDEDIYYGVNRLVAGAKPVTSVTDLVLAKGMVDLSNSINTPNFALKPTFTSPLADANFLLGEDFRFEAEVIGDNPITYQWYRDESPIPGANSTTLSINGGEVSDQGIYRLEATNAGGAKSISARAVAYAPVSEAYDITVAGSNLIWAKEVREPSEQWYLQNRIIPPESENPLAMQSGSIGDDDSSRLMLIATGPTRLEWQWKADCDPTGADRLQLMMNGITERSIKSFAYAPTSWLDNSLNIPAGEHRLIFAYEKDAYIYAGNDASWLASFSTSRSEGSDSGLIDDDGIQIQESKSLTVVEGAPALLYTSQHINESYGITWKHDDISFLNEEEVHYIPVASTESAGRYELFYKVRKYDWTTETYRFEDRKIVFDLNVLTEQEASTPTVIRNQVKKITTSKDVLALTASVESLLPVTYTWTYNGVPVEGAIHSRLTIADFDASKAGLYQFTASNAAGDVTSAPIEVDYIDEAALDSSNPVIVEQPTLVVVEAGTTTNIPVEVLGEDPFSYQWYRDGRPLLGQTSNALRLPDADAVLHRGQYVLEATNAFGSVRTSPLEVSVTSRGGLAEAVDRPGEDWYSVGLTAWGVDYTSTTDGEDAAYILATNMGVGDTSRLETQIMGPATIRFKWNRAGKEYGDLRLLKDGNSTGLSIDSTTGWQQAEYELAEPGLHTISWEFVSRTSTIGGLPSEHMLAWVDDVEIINPAPFSSLPNSIVFSLQDAVDTKLSIGGYSDVEILGLPRWLKFDKTNLSLHGTADRTDSYWLEVIMHKSDGASDSQWIKLAYASGAHDELWQSINQTSAGGSIVDHVSTPSRLTFFYADGKVRSTNNGIDWKEDYIPKAHSNELIRTTLVAGNELYAFSNYGRTYKTYDFENWDDGDRLVGNIPSSSAKIILGSDGAHILDYNGLKYSSDYLGWAEIWADTADYRIDAIFNWEGDLLAHNAYGAEGEGLYRYNRIENTWNLERAIPARGNIFTTDSAIYWAEYSNSRYQLLRISSLTQATPEVLYESTNDLNWVVAHGDLILLWGADRYVLLNDAGKSIRETLTDELSGLRNHSGGSVRLGDSIFVYQGIKLVRVDKAKPNQSSSTESLDSISGIVAAGEKILVEGDREFLVAQDGLNFSYQKSENFSTVAGLDERFIAQLSSTEFVSGSYVYSFVSSLDGWNWSQYSDISIPFFGFSSSPMTEENGILLARFFSSSLGRYRNYYSLDGVEWQLESGPYAERYVPDSLAEFQGKILKTERNYNDPGRGTRLYVLEPDTGWVEVKFFENRFFKLLSLGSDDQIALVETGIMRSNGLYYNLFSNDLESWVEVERSGILNEVVFKNGQLYRTSESEVYIYSDDLQAERKYALPIANIRDIAITDTVIVAADSSGTVIRYSLPDENNPIAGPSYGVAGRIPTEPFLYFNLSTIDENVPRNTSFGEVGYENLELTEPVQYELSAASAGEALYFQLVDGEAVTTRDIDFEATPVLRTLVRATDAEGRIFEDIVEVTINDRNEAPVNLWLTSQVFTESAPVGAPLASIFSSDPDKYESFTYELVTGSGDSDNTMFGIIDDTLILYGHFDVSERMRYSVRLRSSDSEGAFIEKPITLYVVPDTMPHAASFVTWLQVELEDPFAGDQMMDMDPDGDGLSNLLEYYLYTDPEEKNDLQVIQWERRIGEPGMDLVGYFRTNNAALTGNLEVSRDLITWDPLLLEYNNGSLIALSPEFEVIETIEEQPGLWKARIRSTSSEEQIFSRMSVFYDDSNL